MRHIVHRYFTVFTAAENWLEIDKPFGPGGDNSTPASISEN